MATIKEIIQSFCYRINIPAPSSFVGVGSPNERQLLSIFQEIGDNLRNRSYNWPQLKRNYTFTTQTGVSRYDLPGDFYRILPAAQWDQTNQWPLSGPLSDGQMTGQQIIAVGVQNQKSFRVIGPTAHLLSTSPYSKRSSGQFEIQPAGENNTDELFFGYLSCNWVWPRDWVASTAYSAGDIRSVDGYVYICTGSGTSGSDRPSTATVDTNITDGSVTWRLYLEPYLCEPANSKLNDADLCLFDSDIMINGMNWAYKRAKGQDYQSLRADWEEDVKGAFARFEGFTKTSICLDGSEDRPWPYSSPGGWTL